MSLLKVRHRHCRDGIGSLFSVLPAFMLAICGILLSACADTSEPVAAVDTAPLVVEVTVVELQPQTLQRTIRTFGVVEALEEVNVAAELSGTVTAVHVDEGDRVEKGQVLLELDPQKRELAVDQADQQVQRAQAALQEARLKLQRRKNLAEKETISREVLDNAQLSVDASTADYQQAIASQQLAVRELADTRIVSPTAGLVEIQAVEVGEPVQAGASLITLQAVHGLRVHTWVSEADVTQVQSGGRAIVTASGLAGSEFEANIEWVGVNADPATGNFPVKLILAESTDALRPGMTASADLQGISVNDALLLPEAALMDRDRRRVVFVVEQGVAHMREPLLAAGFSNRLQVLDGLAPGDQVVVSRQSLLLDGTTVAVRSAD
ncbi:MAG: efflux RND transporter periplasmic adaptor subunit [Halioglobus sp.]|nr:efflux RND transporter periplasmic adaptor subunit [Halioglobus sp.]